MLQTHAVPYLKVSDAAGQHRGWLIMAKVIFTNLNNCSFY